MFSRSEIEYFLVFLSEVNDIIEMKAEKEKYTFLDNHEVFRDNAAAYYKDGLHLSTEGSRLLAEQFRHKIEVCHLLILFQCRTPRFLTFIDAQCFQWI